MYGSIDELAARQPLAETLQLADDTGLAQDLTDPGVQGVLNDCLNQADGEIDSYLSLLTTVPLTAVPRIIANISVQIARYRLYGRRTQVDLPDAVAKEYSTAQSLLMQIAQRKLDVPGLIESVSAPATGPGLDTHSRRRMLGEWLWERFR